MIALADDDGFEAIRIAREKPGQARYRDYCDSAVEPGSQSLPGAWRAQPALLFKDSY